MNCIFLIFIIRNDLRILALTTIKIIRYNVFNSFFSSFFSPISQVGVYLARVCCYIVFRRNEVFYCDAIIITKFVKKSCEFLIDFAVFASAVSLGSFEALLLKAVNYCVCQHIFPSQWIAFAILTSCIISEVFLPSSIWDTTYFRSSFLYLHFNTVITPASKGCKRDAAHLGRKINFMIVKQVFESGKMYYQERIAFLPSKHSFQSKSPKSFSITSVRIHDLL